MDGDHVIALARTHSERSEHVPRDLELSAVCSVQLVCADKWYAARSGHFLLASLSPLGAMDSSRAIN